MPVIDLDAPPVGVSGRRPVVARRLLSMLVPVLVLAAVAGEPPVRADRLPAPAVQPVLHVDLSICQSPAAQSTTVVFDVRTGQVVVLCGAR